MRKKRRGWIVVLGILLLAFLLWFFWTDLQKLLRSQDKKTVPEKSKKPTQEKILEEERKKLEEIIRKRP